MELEQEQLRYTTSNEAYIQTNVLQLRIDTTDLLDRIKSFLAGGRIAYGKDENGLPMAKFVQEGEPLANELGVQSITSWISMQVNPSTVQGNLTTEQYFSFLERTRKELAKNLLVLAPRYEIKRTDRSLIIGGIINMLELFCSRVIDNKEREGYNNSQINRIGNYTPGEKRSII